MVGDESYMTSTIMILNEMLWFKCALLIHVISKLMQFTIVLLVKAWWLNQFVYFV